MLQIQHLPAQTGSAAGTCMVLLPGAWQQIGDFIAHGFDAAVQRRALRLDLLLVAPQPAHLNDRSWLPSLHDEVLHPARQAGQRLWLGGISLGAFMALRSAAQYPSLVDGLCLIAPYLGSRIVAAEIARFESLQDWQPGTLSADDDERRIWRYLRGLRPPPPHIFVGFGRQDRFADTQALLARSLPADCSLQIEGRHEWSIWRQLWENFLDRGLIES